MRSKVILLAAALVLAASLSACTGRPELAPGRYVSDGAENLILSSALVLERNNRYTLMGPAFVSTVFRGRYTIEGERLLLDSGEHVFIIEDGRLVFESGRWLANWVEPGTYFFLSDE